jgi:O-antigen ligase
MLVLPKTESVGTQLKRSDSITARIENWQNSLQIWKKYLLTGSGYNAYRFTQIQEGLAREEDLLYSHSAGGADSSLLLTGATSGILGVVVLLVFVVRVTNREVKRKFPALAVSIAAVLIHSLFLNSLYYPWVMVWLAILIGEYSRVKGNI